MHPYYVLFAFIVIFLKSTIAFWPFDDNSTSGFSFPTATESGSSSSTGEGFFEGLFGGSDSSATESGSASTDDTNSYAPFNVSCPSRDLARPANHTISDQEKEYLESRHAITNENLINFLKKANISDFDPESFINDNKDQHNITIGVTVSGGGYRAMLCAAGQILGMDGRFSDANDHGLGGLLDSATYVVGLSGGNWMVGSLAMNNWLPVEAIVNRSSSLWYLEDSIINPNGLRLDRTISYYYGLREAVLAKSDAGFETSFTDVWGRALSYQFFTDPSGGENVTWSSMRNLSNFQNHQMPYPIVVANGRTPGTYIINENSTIFEISAYELGSWDPSLNSFTDVQYLGSMVQDGNANTSQCINNFDNAGFIMGTSSSLFNAILLELGDYDINSIIKSILTDILQKVSEEEYDIAAYEPNPFYQFEEAGVKTIIQNETLYLVDGGEDAQNVPFYPLIQNSRDVDVIFAFDNSADTEQQWPNGTSIMMTYKRQFSIQGKGTPFPFVPDVDRFLREEMNEKPVFFGCNASDLADIVAWHDNDNINVTDVPLVVHIANQRFSYNSNFSTFKLSYDDDEKFGAIQNGFEISTRNNLTDDENWLTCVGCAIIRRQQERFGQEQSEECKQCFDKYCWKGGEKDAAPVSSVSGLTGLATLSSTSTSSETSSGSSTTRSGSSSGTSSAEKQNIGNYNTPSLSFIHFLLGLFLL
ncbi:unnamed protein product [Candida verbasci]|uniref:Lysophospholipase n=1 Tax=Candida verbasci TaxID=1227364 RepID=A0A9W4TUM5_9ASCO|nr:unnamed protein product [Candida verbasci]